MRRDPGACCSTLLHLCSTRWSSPVKRPGFLLMMVHAATLSALLWVVLFVAVQSIRAAAREAAPSDILIAMTNEGE